MIFIVTVLNFKDLIDLPKWRPLSSSPIFSTAGVNIHNIIDYRNNEDRHPFIFHYVQVVNTISQFAIYNFKNDDWIRITNTISITGGSFCVGMVMMPAQGPRGTIAAGATTTTIPLSTALPGAVVTNGLANRGDGIGYKMRIIGSAAGSSGLTEERIVIANTLGTTPTLVLDSPLSFAPILGDAYEFLSGKIYVFSNGGAFLSYDIITGVGTSLAASGITTETNPVGLDELHVPYDKNPGEGFLGNIVATASGAASITGQAVGGDASVLANEYRNFQIRIIEDIAIPTAVGQRRNITSHTAGPSPVYTVPAWAVTPSATATYVIENNGDRILTWNTNSTTTRTYTISTNTWSTVLFSALSNTTAGTYFAHQAFSIEPDTTKNVRHSFIYISRGTSGYMIFDIAGAATGTSTTFTTLPPLYAAIQFPWSVNVTSVLDPATNEGRYIYINSFDSALPNRRQEQRFYRFDMKNTTLEPMTLLRAPVISSITSPNIAPYKPLTWALFKDGLTKLSFLIFTPINTENSSILAFSLPITR